MVLLGQTSSLQNICQTMTPLHQIASFASSLLLLGAVSGNQASAQVLVEFDPVDMQASAVPVFPTNSAPSLIASELMQTGFGSWGNTNVWPVGQIGVASATLDPAKYLSFTVNAPSQITYASLTYSRLSYVGDGNRAAAVRTSVDNFVTDVAVVTGIDPQGLQQIDFNLSGMTPTLGLVEFRVYFYDAPTAGADWVDLVSSNAGGTGLVLNGDVSDDVGLNYCMANANSSGSSATIDGSGSTTIAANDLTLGADNLPVNSFGFFITSQAQGFVMNPGGSQGNLCLSGAVGRYVGPGQVQQAGASGRIELLIDLTMVPQPNGSASVLAGDTWNFQAWYRDAVSGVPTSNFTDGLQVDF